MKLGIVLATRADLDRAVAIALAARRARHEVSLFAMDEGAHVLASRPEAARSMLDADCELIVCSNSAVGFTYDDAITRGSQDDHAAVVGTSDRVIALT